MVPRDIEGVFCAVEEWNSGGMEARRTQLYLLPLGWAVIHILESMIAKHTEHTILRIYTQSRHTHTSRQTHIHTIFELIEHKKYPIWHRMYI
jgi:hypothetical protein